MFIGGRKWASSYTGNSYHACMCTILVTENVFEILYEEMSGKCPVVGNVMKGTECALNSVLMLLSEIFQSMRFSNPGNLAIANNFLCFSRCMVCIW